MASSSHLCGTNSQQKDFSSDDKKTKNKESSYANVPNGLLYCHLCKTHMWDANSFETHIKDSSHVKMREYIEESYNLKASMIRQDTKIAEQLKSIDLEGVKHMEYCKLCDLKFHGNISAHLESDGHLQLEEYLNPKCGDCNMEFANRIDYDTHLLTADHFIRSAESKTKAGDSKRQTLPIFSEKEELKDVRPTIRRMKTPQAKKEDAKDDDNEE